MAHAKEVFFFHFLLEVICLGWTITGLMVTLALKTIKVIPAGFASLQRLQLINTGQVDDQLYSKDFQMESNLMHNLMHE